jgi:hypothetical protein
MSAVKYDWINCEATTPICERGTSILVYSENHYL